MRKQQMSINLLIAIFFILTAHASSQQWKYSPPYAARMWYHFFSKCGGGSQSPINIDTEKTVSDPELGPFHRSMFSSYPLMVMRNNGHTLHVDIEDGYIINDTSVLPGIFKALQFHMHWGAEGSKGSEHTLNGKRFFGELHIVHYNTKYKDVKTAIKQRDGLAVLGFFIKEDYPQDNLDFNQILKPITSNQVNYLMESKEFATSFSLETILPHNIRTYYRYNGSLTTPTCDESVIWTVFDDPIRISQNQANILTSLVFETRRGRVPILPLNGNYRPVQPLNGRTVKRSKGFA